MKVVINVGRSQLREVLQELGGSFSDMDVVINVKEEESKGEELEEEESEEKPPNYESLTTEDLEEMKEKEQYPT